MLKKFTIRRGADFVCLVWADRFEVPRDENGCFHFYVGERMVCGAGSHYNGVRVFAGGALDPEVPILPGSLNPVTPFMDDFTQAGMVRVEAEAA